MKISTSEQRDLLELANLERSQNPEVSRSLPEKEELTKLVDARDRQRTLAQNAQLSVSDVELDIRRIQSDMAKLNRRIKADRDGLGAATDIDDRRDLEHDLVAANRRMSDLQQELKEAHDEVHALRMNVDRHGADLDELERKVASAERALGAAEDAEASSDRAYRVDTLRSELNPEVLAAYDEQRAVSGVGAAAIRGRSCGGCHLILPPAAIAKIRATPLDEMPQCPDCGTYLVRI